MGASAKKRKAAKAAATQYYQAFAKLNAIPELSKVSTSNKRDIEEALGDNTSFRTRNLAQKADRMAREINNDEDYKKNVGAYNDRYQILKDQIANKSSVRYSISGQPIAAPQPASTPFNWVQQQYLNNTNNGMLGAISQAPAPKPQSSFATQGSMFKTKEEAIADAKKQMETYNSGLSKIIGTQMPRANNGILGGAFNVANYSRNYTKADVDAMRINDPSRFIKQEEFKGFDVLYRDLSKAEGAANDLNALGENFNNSTGTKNAEAYAALANKLKPLIKKDARDKGVLTGNQSMVSGELASATPYTETIK